MKRFLAIFAVFSALLMSGCAELPNTSAGAGIGAIGGAILSPNDPAGGAILGGIGGAAIGNIFDRNNQSGGYYGGNGRYDDCRGCGYRGNGYGRDREYQEQMERRRRFEQQRRWEEQQRYYRRDCYRCGY